MESRPRGPRRCIVLGVGAQSETNSSDNFGITSMARILVSGASGFVGRSLTSYLASLGHEVVKLVRSEKLEERPSVVDSIYWNPEERKATPGDFEGFDAVFHLAGEPISAGRWTQSRKQKILQSRTIGTYFLSQILSGLAQPPKFFLSASAVGFYGDRGEELLVEESQKGRGFLADVCSSWERATAAIENRGVRTVHTRFGLVLGKGGALPKMVLAYKLGLGGRLGSGRQWISWISLDDLIHAINYIWMKTSLEGAVNLVAPHPVRQKEFSQVLGQALHRPAKLAIPGWILKLLLGEMAEEVLLASTLVRPRKLLDSGFSFSMPDLFDALRKALK